MAQSNSFNRVSWAIQLSDSQHRTWKSKARNSQLVFQWEGVFVNRDLSPEEMLNAVSKRFSDAASTDKTNLANGIYNYFRVKIGDLILGVEGKNTIKRIGIVGEVNKRFEDDFRLMLNIKWFSRLRNIRNEINIFDPLAEIQPITPEMGLAGLPLDIILNNSGHEAIMSFKHKRFYGSDEPEKIVPPAKIVSEKEDKGGKISLFYGTNRSITGKNDYNNYYGDDLDILKFGKCLVSIPKGHIQGDVERPKKIMWIELRENIEKHIVVENISETEEDVFFKIINADLKNAEQKSALVFVHGYNNTFAEAARRTAQIAWDMPFKGISGFFSWPSRGETTKYFVDDVIVDTSITDFEDFIEKLVFNTGVEKIHFIAHSMGNRLLTSTLNILLDKESFKGKLGIIQQIVLAAPDIDQNNFRRLTLPKFSKIGERRTLYTSDQDLALVLSEKNRGGLVRLGEAGGAIFVDSNLDTVDASNVECPGILNHGYIFETKELLTDLHLLINLKLPPIDRRLKARDKDKLKYWLFPE